MEKYINKDALVAEIKRLIECCYKMCAGDLDFLQKSYPKHYYSIETYKEILYFLDTLEVKKIDFHKVDFEKEVEDWMKIGPHTSYPWCTIPDAIKITAEHFYELGLTAAQKGE